MKRRRVAAHRFAAGWRERSPAAVRGLWQGLDGLPACFGFDDPA